MTCIGIALCFWLLNKLSTSFTKNIPLKVEYKLPEGKTLSHIPPQYALVTVRGTGWDILSGRSENTIRLELTADSLQMFSLRNAFTQNTSSEVISINPDLVSLATENAFSKEVKIELITNIHFENGYDFAEDIRLDPSVVTVYGPKSYIDRITVIKTDTLKAFNLIEKKVQKVKLLTHPLLNYNVQETEATILAEQFTEKSMFIPIVVKNAPQKLKIFPNKIKLDCTVALSKYAQLSAANFVAEVDLKGVALNTTNNTIAILLSQQPNFVRNIKFTPKAAEFYFEN